MPTAPGRLLIIDDEERFGQILGSQLESCGYSVSFMTDGADALLAYDSLAPDVVIVDLSMPRLDGLQVLTELRRHDPAASVILLSGKLDVRTTVRALRMGAEDVQTKPTDLDLLTAAIERGMQRARAMRSLRVTSTQVSDPYGFFDESPAMLRVLRTIEQLAKSALPVLIVGEAGTGKQVAAEMLHQLSPRAARPFVRVTCAGLREHGLRDALADVMVEMRPQRPGRSAAPEAAGGHGGGTLFLDGVCHLSPASQALLLSVLSGEFAGTADGTPAVRVVAATTRDLTEDVRARTMDGELYHRLSVLPISLPSLRSRGGAAIMHVATRLVQAERFALGRGPRRVTAEAVALLESLTWPGNVRQLRNVIEEAFLLALESEALEPVHLRDVLEQAGLGEDADAPSADRRSLERVEQAHIARVLTMTRGQRTEAARILGITRPTLYKKMRQYGLEHVGCDPS